MTSTTYSSFSALEKEGLLKKANRRECLSTRPVFVILALFGFFNIYTMRVNLSVGLVAMTNWTLGDKYSSNSSDDNCLDVGQLNGTTPELKTGEFNWDEETQGFILGSFYYGYILTQIPGGWLATRYGGKRVLGFSILCTSVFTMLTPLAARSSLYLLIAVRVLEGIGEGVSYPAVHSMLGRWAPVMERTQMVSIIYSGASIGTVVSLPVSGFLSASDFLGGWPSVFYVFGAVGFVWFVFWMLLVHDSPADQPRIGEGERHSIEASTGNKEIIPTPWRSIFTSPAVLCLATAHSCFHWGHFMLITSLPIYMHTILRFDIKQNGLLSALPYLALWAVQSVVGFPADHLRSNGYLSTKNVRKLFTSIGLLVPSVLLLAVTYVGCDHVSAVILVILAVAFNGFIYAGCTTNHLDIAPRFAGVLMGLTNMFATIPGFVAPSVVGILTKNNQTITQWRIIFLINGVISLVGTIIFNIFSQGEELHWAIPTSHKK